jgi:hypothetical protein
MMVMSFSVIEANEGHDARQKDVRGRLERVHEDPLSLQIAHGAHGVVGEQLQAAHMAAGEQEEGISGIDADQQRPGEGQRDLRLTGGDGLRLHPRAGIPNVVDVRESFALEQRFGDVLRGGAHARGLSQRDLLRLWRRLGRSLSRVRWEQGRGRDSEKSLGEHPSVHESHPSAHRAASEIAGGR